MICQNCFDEFPEKDIQESHDVPCYLFQGNRKGRENQADKFGRHNLCAGCHEEYEKNLNGVLKEISKKFSKRWFSK